MNKTLFEVSGLTVQAGAFKLQDISFSLGREAYLIVLGPTGCGKTMLLETLAGLRKPVTGRILLEDEDITGRPPEARSFGFAYQDSLLYPFLNVKENILFGARAQKKHKEKTILNRLDKLAEVMGISHLLDRYPRSLSGGEKQRVSLARAILSCPPLLFLDEPLSCLDPQTRCSMQELLRDMHQTENLGIIHVTHDFNEALQLGTELIVMNQGRICQQGKPAEVFNKPDSLFVANFLMQKNIKQGVLEKKSSGHWFRNIPGDWSVGPLPEKLIPDRSANDLRQEIYLMFHPSELRVTPDTDLSSVKPNSWKASVEKIIFHSSHIELICQGGGRWQVVMSMPEWRQLELREGSMINLSVVIENVHLILRP